MDQKTILDHFTRPQRLLLGASGKLAVKWKLPPVAIRTAFMVLTLIFIPLGALLYLVAHWAMNKMGNHRLGLALLGGLLGIPLGYYFQSDTVRAMAGGMAGYLKKFPEIVDTVDRFLGDGLQVVWNGLLGVVVVALIGFVLGHMLDRGAAMEKKDGNQ